MIDRKTLEASIKDAITNCTSSINSLLDLVKRGNMELGDASDRIDEVITKKKRRILQEHKKYCGIWKGTDNRWKTKVPDENAKEKRKLLSCRTLEDLENKIVEFYETKLSYKPSLRVIYKDWIEFKEAETSYANVYKIQHFWKRYYKDDKIIDVPLKDLTVGKIKGFLLRNINTKELTKKQYKDMKSVINMMLDYAVEHEYVEGNNANRVKGIRDNKFRKPVQKPVREVVYMNDIQAEVVSKAEKLFEETGNTAYLAICLNFTLGLRVGELVALKSSDITGNKIHISRGEVKRYEKDKQGKVHRIGVEVANHTKTECGERDLIFTKKARSYVDKALEYNRENGLKDDDYIFLDRYGKRKHADSVENALRHVNGTRNEKDGYDIVGRPSGNHSIRRTVISNWDASKKIPDALIQEMAGHKDFSTTKKYYIHPTSTIDEYADIIEDICENQ